MGAEGLCSLIALRKRQSRRRRVQCSLPELSRQGRSEAPLMTKRVGVTLRLQRVNGIVRSESGPGQYMVWEIARGSGS